jgi:creatinine amidohydrolase/Fe(II)-dependent formamide hydrolase-like protein
LEIEKGRKPMRFEMMRPHQIRTAIEENWPVVLPLGVLEYHGEHLAVGMDTLVVIEMVELMSAEMDMVILPPFYYGAASYAVAPPEGNGSVQVDGDALYPLAREMFISLLRIGFRNIHFFIHHQTENFDVGMPTDLAFKFGARQAIFRFLEKERGEGWWGDDKNTDYYAHHAGGTDPFNWISGHPLMTREIIAQYPFDHADIGETSLLMALCPQGVEMERHAAGPWFTKGADKASVALGEKGRDLILMRMRKVLGGA